MGAHACIQASKLPPAFDRAWEKIGGGPADLYFPEEFLGVWNVESTLTSVKLPLGPDFVPDPKVNLSLLNLDVSPETLDSHSIKPGRR